MVIGLHERSSNIIIRLLKLTTMPSSSMIGLPITNWRLTLDDERLCKAHRAVDKDGDRGNPVAGGGVVTAKMEHP